MESGLGANPLPSGNSSNDSWGTLQLKSVDYEDLYEQTFTVDELTLHLGILSSRMC